MKKYHFIILLLIPICSFAENLNQWRQENYSFTQDIYKNSIKKNDVFQLNAKKGDAIFIDDELIYLCTVKNETILLESNTISNFINNNTKIKFEVQISDIKKNFFFYKSEYNNENNNLQVIPIEKLERNYVAIAFLVFGAFLVIVKLLFPVYFSFVFLSIKSTINIDASSEFKNGAIFFSAIFSSLFISFIFASNRFSVQWEPVFIGFSVVLGYFTLRYFLNFFFSLLLKDRFLISNLYLDWLFNIIRISFILVAFHLIMIMIEADFLYLVNISLVLILIIPTLINIVTAIKNINLLPINFLFLYLCALEILPTIILIKILK